MTADGAISQKVTMDSEKKTPVFHRSVVTFAFAFKPQMYFEDSFIR